MSAPKQNRGGGFFELSKPRRPAPPHCSPFWRAPRRGRPAWALRAAARVRRSFSLPSFERGGGREKPASSPHFIPPIFFSRFPHATPAHRTQVAALYRRRSAALSASVVLLCMRVCFQNPVASPSPRMFVYPRAINIPAAHPSPTRPTAALHPSPTLRVLYPPQTPLPHFSPRT